VEFLCGIVTNIFGYGVAVARCILKVFWRLQEPKRKFLGRYYFKVYLKFYAMAFQISFSKFLLTTPVIFCRMVLGLAGATMKEAVFLQKLGAAFGNI
jgi:hypothetical protein